MTSALWHKMTKSCSYFEEPSLVCAQSENEETSTETGLGSDELMDTERVNR